ncbi:hypothetical protein [Adhaeribacter aquaticus]|uniref:hypothetical protein n=1 Tax=Adhaeribacter aquaticus TaxID=299567 RepID=UPI00047AE627|nr:hypothetical protein [Adhaeribacter aquaticus]
MKRSVLTLCFICFVTVVTLAQNVPSSTEKRISLLTRVMASELGLNEIEYMKLKSLNTDRLIKADELAELYKHDHAMLARKIYELETSYDRKLKAMLNPNQLNTYAAYRHSPASDLAFSDPKGAALSGNAKQ